MIVVGAVGQDDKSVGKLLDAVCEAIGRTPTQSSVADSVAIAQWSEVRAFPQACGEHHASIGTLRGDFPRPGVELRGDFALVARTGRALRLARGRFGGRPLYWISIGSAAVACNRLLPLAQVARRDLRLNVEYLLSLFEPRIRLLRGLLPFIGAQRVLANTVLDIYPSGRTEVHVGPLPVGPELVISVRDLAQTLRQEFEAAVARQTTGARRVAVFAGGGVDSSNLLAAAVRNARYRGCADVVPVALDLGGPGDDRPHLRVLCSQLRIDPLRVAPSEGAAFAGDDRIVDASAHGTTPSSAVIACLHRAMRAGADRILTGDASEYLFNAAPDVFADFFCRDLPAALRCIARFQSANSTSLGNWRAMVAGPLYRRFVPASVRKLRDEHIQRRIGQQRARDASWIGPRLKQFLATVRRENDSIPSIRSQRDRVLDLAGSPLLMTFPESASRWESLVGLPISFPYLDDDYAMLLSRVPSAAIFAGARERGLLRESMEGLVPDSVRYRTDKARGDHGFAELFIAMGGYASVRDLATMRELEQLGIVSGRSFRAALERFASDPYADPSQWLGMLWSAITAEAYVRWFRDFTAARPISSLPSTVTS